MPRSGPSVATTRSSVGADRKLLKGRLSGPSPEALCREATKRSADDSPLSKTTQRQDKREAKEKEERKESTVITVEKDGREIDKGPLSNRSQEICGESRVMGGYGSRQASSSKRTANGRKSVSRSGMLDEERDFGSSAYQPCQERRSETDQRLIKKRTSWTRSGQKTSRRSGLCGWWRGSHPRRQTKKRKGRDEMGQRMGSAERQLWSLLSCLE